MKFLLYAVLLQASPGADGSPPYSDPDSIDVVETARHLIEASLPLSAGDLLSRHLSQSRDEAADPGRVLLAARAYADGRAWSAVLRLLLGQPWLGEMDAGVGLLEVGRAFAGLDSLNAALASYRRNLGLFSASEDAAESGVPVEFRAEYASLLSRLEEHAAAASQYEMAAKERPELARWFRLSALQELARAGDLDRARSLAADLERDSAVPEDSVRMELTLAAFRSGD
jgi:hypothetical protein